jgi:hypothetical protein
VVKFSSSKKKRTLDRPAIAAAKRERTKQPAPKVVTSERGKSKTHGSGYQGPAIKAKPLSTKPSSNQVKAHAQNKPKSKPAAAMSGKARKGGPGRSPTGPSKKSSGRETSISISNETAIGRGLNYVISGSPSRTVEDRKKRAQGIKNRSR